MGAFKLIDRQSGIFELLFDTEGEKVNILSTEAMKELDNLLDDMKNRGNIKVLLFTSAKKNIFIAGADINEIKSISDESEGSLKAKMGQDIFMKIEKLPFPTIAVIDGAAMGGGMEFALSCSYRLVSDNPKTKLALPEVNLGVLPGFGGTVRLPRAIGLMAALDMILSGKTVDGKKALKSGLADGFYPQAFLMDKAMEFALKLSKKPYKPQKMKPRKKRPLMVKLLEGPFKFIVFNNAKKTVMKKTRGNYPAPLLAIQTIKKNIGKSDSKAYTIEHQAFGKLSATEICKNLTGLFFSTEASKRPQVEGASGGKKSISKAAVLGAGVMGGKIAWLFSKNDIPVVMKDISWDAVSKGYQAAHEVYAQLQKIRKLDKREAGLKMQLISGAVDYKALGNPDIVVEAVVENLEIKKKVLAELEAHVREDTIIVSNTSSLSINDMASALKHPERFLGMHFFNPVNRMPLVEIIAGEKTSPDAIKHTAELTVGLGKTPVIVQDCSGFIVNRLLMPYLNEASYLIEHPGDFKTMDKEFLDFGLPMGPFTLLDEIGIDVGHKVAKVLHDAYGERMKPGKLFELLAERKDLLGKKGKKGFYLYGNKKRGVKNPEMDRLIGKVQTNRKKLSSEEIIERPLFIMVNEAARCLDEKAVASAEMLDLALIMGMGFPPFTGGLLKWADSIGLDRVVKKLEGYASEYGERFTPSTYLKDLAQKAKGFYS
jgi:3-hydroxyacyl-CoA dehydrogenase/enoyl-CoA hydratase/3-hydroxybutyryl-CoA epimerase